MRSSLVLLAVSLAVTTLAQQSATTVRDPQAQSIMQQSLVAMGGTLPSDSIATGSVTMTAGSLTQTGTVRVMTKSTAQTLKQVTLPNQTYITIYSSWRANEVTAGGTNPLPLELVATSQASEFPMPLLAALLNDPNTSLQYVGLEVSNGLSLEHIRTWDSFASQPDWQSLSSFSTRDVWIDASSGLPQRISYVRRPAHGAVAGVVIDVFYANYESWSGVLYPTTIQESLNGTPWATITIGSVSFNTGLTDADFPIQ